MKPNVIAVTGIGLLVLFVMGFASIFEIRLASAQVDATSSPPSATDSTTTPILKASTSSTSTEEATTSTPANGPSNDAAASTSTADATSAASTSTPSVEPPPEGLTEVRIIGTKYVDYFTDGTTTLAFPGDPAIDSHFDAPNAPIPTHEGLTWVHTTGQHLYDTPSGDLEVGDYAVEPSGAYVENPRPSTWVSSTSTPAQIATSTTSSAATDTSSSPSNDASSSVPDASTTVPVALDTSATTANAESTTSPTL
jgi:hypothetical protein